METTQKVLKNFFFFYMTDKMFEPFLLSSIYLQSWADLKGDIKTGTSTFYVEWMDDFFT